MPPVLLPMTLPPSAKPGAPALIQSRKPRPTFFAELALMTYSLSDSQAGILSAHHQHHPMPY
jgi:hypothetical protein